MDDDSETSIRRTMLEGLFLNCDPMGIGHVRTVDLVGKLKELVEDNPAVDKWLISELSRMLDPRGDNGAVAGDDFVRIGLQWIRLVDCKARRLEDDGHDRSLGLLDQATIRMLESTSLTATTTSSSSSGRNNETVFESLRSRSPWEWRQTATRTTNPVVVQPETLEFGLHVHHHDHHQQDLVVTQMCINKRLVEEVTTLKKQLASAELEAVQMQQENDQLRQEAKSRSSCSSNSKAASNTSATFIVKDDLDKNNNSNNNVPKDGNSDGELGIFVGDGEHSYLDRLCQLEHENGQLASKLRKQSEELENALKAELNNTTSTEELRVALKEAKEARVKTEVEAKSLATEMTACTARMEESFRINQKLEEEIQRLQQELTTFTEDSKQWQHMLGGAGDGHPIHSPLLMKSFFGFDEGFDVEMEDDDTKKTSNESTSGQMSVGGPGACSTPFIDGLGRGDWRRKSIGHEMKRLGVVGSPLFDKGSNQWSQSSKEKESKAVATMQNEESGGEQSEANKYSDVKWCLGDIQHFLLKLRKDVKCLEFLDVLHQVPKPALQIVILWITLLLLFLVLFTFFGAMEIDGKTYYPITWKRWMPEPFVIFSLDHRASLEKGTFVY